MKEQIEKAAREYAERKDASQYGLLFQSVKYGANMVLDQYNGITPDTAKEMRVALEELWFHTRCNNDIAGDGSYAIDSLFGKVSLLILKLSANDNSKETKR